MDFFPHGTTTAVLTGLNTSTIKEIWEINNSEHNLDHCFTYEFSGSNQVLSVCERALSKQRKNVLI